MANPNDMAFNAMNDGNKSKADYLEKLESEEAVVKGGSSQTLASTGKGTDVADIDVYSSFTNVTHPKAGTKYAGAVSEVLGDSYSNLAETWQSGVEKGSIASKLGEKTTGEFTVSGTSPDVGDFSYRAWSEPGKNGADPKYFYSGKDKGGKSFTHEFSKETYGKWAKNLEDRSERLANVTDEDTSSIENIKKVVRGKPEVTAGPLTQVAAPEKRPGAKGFLQRLLPGGKSGWEGY